MDYLFIFLVGLVSSFFAGITGGGAGLVVLPALMAVGIPPLEAIGAMKLGFIGFVGSSYFSESAKPHIRRDYTRPLILLTVFSSIVGPLFAFKLGQDQVKIIASALILITALVSLFSWRFASNSRQVSQRLRYSGYAAYFLTGILLSAFGAGISLLSNYIVIILLGMSPLESVATRRIVGLVAVPIQFAMFAIGGYVDYKAGVMLGIGLAIGGLLGLNYAVKKGNNFVKKAMAIASIALIITLFI